MAMPPKQPGAVVSAQTSWAHETQDWNAAGAHWVGHRDWTHANGFSAGSHLLLPRAGPPIGRHLDEFRGPAQGGRQRGAWQPGQILATTAMRFKRLIQCVSLMSLGQASMQFAMLWQRHRPSRSLTRARRAAPHVSRLSAMKR